MTIPANFTAHNTDPYINVQWWVAIDGLRYRYGTCLPTWNPTDTTTNQTVKDYMSDMIQCRAQKVEPLNGKTTSHGLTISLLDVGDDVTELFSVHDNTNKAWTTITANCTAAATTLTVSATSAFTTPCELFVGGETMWATSKSTLTFTVARAKYGSIAEDHLTTDDAELPNTIEVWNSPRYIVGRGITLYESRDGLAEADAIKMRCVIDSVAEKHGVWTISASGHLSKMAAQLNKNPVWRYIFKNAQGWVCIFGGVGTLPTPTATKTPLIKFGDAFYKYITITSLDAYPDYDMILIDPTPVYFVHPSGGAQMAGGSAPGQMGSGEDYEGKLFARNEFVDGDAITLACSHHLFYGGTTAYRDPLSVLLCLLLSKKGDKTNHATYDILPEGMGLGWPAAWVDVTGIEALRDSEYLGELDLMFLIPPGEDAKKWIEENLLRPNMLFLVEKWDGTVSVGRLLTRNQAIVAGSALSITESNLLELPEFSVSNFPIGKIVWKVNWDPIEDEFLGEITTIFQESIRRYHGNARNYELECKTCYDGRIGVGGRVWRDTERGEFPAMIGNYIATMWDRFAVNPMPTAHIEIPYNHLTDVPPGAVVQLTCSVTPNLRNSARGLTAEWFQVVEAQPNPKTSSVKLLLWQIGVHDMNSARYAPSARLLSKSDNYLGSGQCLVRFTPTCNYTVADFGGDAHQFVRNDKVRFYTQNYVSLDSRTYTIFSTAASLSNSARLSEASLKFSVASGYIMETANFDECTAYQTTYWGFQSGTDDKLGANSAEGKQRT